MQLLTNQADDAATKDAAQSGHGRHKPGGNGPSWYGPGWLGPAALMAGVAVCYAIAARISLALVPPPEHIAVFWPASGLAAGLLIAIGRGAQVPVALGVFLGTVAANMLAREHLGATLVFGLCNAAECLIVARLVWSFDTAQIGFEALRGALVVFAASIAGAALAAVPAAIALRGFGLSTAPIETLWFVWFKSDAVGIVSIAPLLVTLPTLWREPSTGGKVVEGAVAVALVGAAGLYSFGLRPVTPFLPMIEPATLLFPPLLWLAIRMRPVYTAMAIALFTVVLTWCLMRDAGPLGDPSVPLANRIVSAQLAILTLALCGLSLVSSMTHLGNTALALKQSEERLWLGLNAGSVYTFDFDFVNNRAHRFGGLINKLGLPAVGSLEDYDDRLHPDDRAHFDALLASMSPRQPFFTARLRLRAVDGTYLYVVHRAEATFDAKGHKIRSVGTCVDVSQRQQAQEALQASEERLSNSLKIGRVFAFDANLLTREVKRSANAPDILGVPPDKIDMTRDEFERHLHPDDRAGVARDTAALTPEHPLNASHCRFVRPDGRVVWLENMQGGTFDASGRLVQVSGLTRDVTEAKIAEERQSNLIDELNHRVKNSLARMNAVITRSREGHTSVETYVQALEGRIKSMARTHQRLSANTWDGIDIATLVRDELEPYRTATNTRVDGPQIVLAPDAAQAVSLTLHELATNAAKHGALSRGSGAVTVEWGIETTAGSGQVLKLRWQETTDWDIDTTPKEGFGVTTIRQLMNFEYEANVRLEFGRRGLSCVVELPLELALARAADIATPDRQGARSKSTTPSQ